MKHVDTYLSAWRAVDGRVSARTQATYLVSLYELLRRRGRHHRTPLDAFLVAMSAVATTNVEPYEKKTLVNALIHHHRHDID